MADHKPSKEMMAELVRAGIFEALCIAAGVIGYFATGKWIWIVMGVLAGLSFSVPAIIKLVREARERNRASR
jgi:uncharacterized membrane protein (UPF0136 family)